MKTNDRVDKRSSRLCSRPWGHWKTGKPADLPDMRPNRGPRRFASPPPARSRSSIRDRPARGRSNGWDDQTPTTRGIGRSPGEKSASSVLSNGLCLLERRESRIPAGFFQPDCGPAGRRLDRGAHRRDPAAVRRGNDSTATTTQAGRRHPGGAGPYAPEEILVGEYTPTQVR